MQYGKQLTPYLNVPLSDALFTVDTRDGLKPDGNGFVYASSNSNVYDINIYKNQQLFSGAVERIALTEINMPWVVPNVNEYNNVLYLESATGETFALGDDTYVDELGATASTAITRGFYTPSQLATEVQTRLNGANALGTNTWTVQYTTNSIFLNFNRFVITNSGSVQFRINPKYGQPKGSGSNLDGVILTRSDTLATMMGFGSTAPTNYAATVIGSYASMLYTTYVDVVSSIICKNQDVRDTSTSYFTGNNILARIYIAKEGYDDGADILGTSPFHLHYNFPVPKQIQWSKDEFLPSCNIQLRDMYGNLLYSPNSNTFNFSTVSSYIGNTSYVQLSMLISEAKP